MLIDPREFPLGPDFKGRVRLFPLPELVLFPHMVQPLHIFEPRYREMLAEAVAADGLITMTTLIPGETTADGRPAIETTACIGKIVAHQSLPDGRSSILLAGARRARILRELPLLKSFREAQVSVLDDVYLGSPFAVANRPVLRQRLLSLVKSMLTPVNQETQPPDPHFADELSLGALSDIVASTHPWPLAFKKRLLSERVVDFRAYRLVQRLDKPDGPLPLAAPVPRRLRYPLDFSAN